MIDRITPLLLYIGLVWGQDDPNPERFEKSPQGDRASIGSFIQWDKKNSVPQDPIVFVGSSSIRKWPTAEYFPDLPIINRGFGGSHISDVNYYVSGHRCYDMGQLNELLPNFIYTNFQESIEDWVKHLLKKKE